MDLELPEIRAWAREKLSGYTDGDVDRIIQKWSSAPRTRYELLWLERTLRKVHASNR